MEQKLSIKLPVWVVDNEHVVSVKPGIAQHKEVAYAGHTRYSKTIHCWIRSPRHPGMQPFELSTSPRSSLRLLLPAVG